MRRPSTTIAITLAAAGLLAGCPAPPPEALLFGGPSSDWCYGLDADAGGGVVLTGRSRASGFGGMDGMVVRTDAQGQALWTQRYGGPRDDELWAGRLLPDGGLILGGSYMFPLSENGEDLYLVRTNAQGDVLWEKTYGGPEWDVGYDVQPLADGGFILAGHTSSEGAGSTDAFLVRTNAAGEALWTKTYGAADSEFAFSVRVLEDGGFLLGGSTLSYGGDFDMYLVRTNSSGQALWTHVLDDELDNVARAAEPLPGGGVLLAGWTSMPEKEDGDAYLVRLDAERNVAWAKTFGGPLDDIFQFAEPLPDDRFVAGGRFSQAPEAESDQVYLVQVDGDGELVWSRQHGGPAGDEAHALVPLPSGGFAVGGSTRSWGAQIIDMYLLKTDAQGNATPF